MGKPNASKRPKAEYSYYEPHNLALRLSYDCVLHQETEERFEETSTEPSEEERQLTSESFTIDLYQTVYVARLAWPQVDNV